MKPWRTQQVSFVVLLAALWSGGVATAMTDNLFVRNCQLVLVSDVDAISASDNDVSTLVAKNRMAATEMAVQHLGQRDGSVVSEVASMSCTVNFTLHTILAESHLSAIQGIVEHYADSAATSHVDALEEMEVEQQEKKKKLCIGIVGPFQRHVIQETRALAQSLDIPQVTVGTVNPSMEQTVQSTDTHNLTWTRNNYIQTSDLVRTAVQYWNSGSRHRTHMSIIYDIMGLDALFASYVASRQELRHVQFAYFPMATRTVTTQEGLADLIGDTLREVKEFGYHTLVAAFEDVEAILPLFAEIADRDFQLVGGDNLWTFLTGLDQTLFPQQEVVTTKLTAVRRSTHASLYRLLKGSALIRPLDGFEARESRQEDAFLQSWRSFNATQVNHNHKDTNVDNEVDADDLLLEPDFFQSPDKGPFLSTSFVYDAVLSLAFRFCNGHSHKVNFQGASGVVQYHAESDHSRAFETVSYGLYNIRALPGDEELQVALVSIRDAGKDGTAPWRKYQPQDTSIDTNFIYHDGSTTPPTRQRLDGDGSYIGRNIRIAGLTAMAVSLLVIVVAALWVRWNWKKPVVKAGQPEFLLLICAGAVILASSVFPASLDERAGYDAPQLQVACVSIPWLFCLGAMSIDCALFCKLWRINKLFQFKRRSVTVLGVLGPFAFFLMSCILVLTIWSIRYPMHWERKQVSEIPYVTAGSCEGDHLKAFVVPLLILTMAPTLLTAVMAWKTRDIPGDYAQTQWIFNALLVMSQVWIVGVPTFVVLGDKNTNVKFMGYAIMVLIYAVAAVLLVILPQVYTVWIEASDRSRPSSRVKSSGQPLGQGGVFVSGLSNTTPSSHAADTSLREQANRSQREDY